VGAMKDLLASVIEPHGGLKRWQELRTGNATFVSGGELLDRKAPQKSRPRRVTVALHEQFSSMTPFRDPDQRSSFRPDRVAIETARGDVVAERLDPRAGVSQPAYALNPDLHSGPQWEDIYRSI
jgi:hypothetical protein